MKSEVGPLAVLAAVLLSAAGLRLAHLGNRPMHCDEAVHAMKFGRLLENGDYAYDPHEYHGPSLNFLTLPVAWSASTRKLAHVTEVQLRLVPAVFGVGLVGLAWLFRNELGTRAALFAATLTAVSPAMVFYSRYYIQEMLLVFFTGIVMMALRRLVWSEANETAGAVGRRLAWTRGKGWPILLGAGIGMMHATKETCVIALAAMALATVFALPRREGPGTPRAARPLLLALCSAAAVSACFFSSFLRNPRGIADSYATYLHYLGRAGGEGTAEWHVHPWHYYFEALFWWRRGDGHLWTEMTIAVLAFVGLIAAVSYDLPGRSTRPGLRFLVIYSFFMAIVYAAIPYKTPWCALGFLHGLILLAGAGADMLIRAVPGRAMKAVVLALLMAVVGHLGWQAWRASFLAFEDPRNPYVYAHTSGDVVRLAELVTRIAVADPNRLDLHVQVVCPDDDYWPLPWYLRAFHRVGWFHSVPAGPPAPLVITQPGMEADLLRYLYETPPPGQRNLYVPVPPPDTSDEWYLRPGVPLRVYATLELWEKYLAAGGEDGRLKSALSGITGPGSGS